MTGAASSAPGDAPKNGGEFRIEAIAEELPFDFPELIAEAERQGHEFVRRFFANWQAGSERFAGPGEGIFAAYLGHKLVGIAGIAVDPYVKDSNIGRIRHVFVRRAARREGVASALVATCLERGRRFRAIRLRTRNPDAARIYERFGFAPVDLKDASHIRKLSRYS
jgi:GNAT superfamily N-acetyltransferase